MNVALYLKESLECHIHWFRREARGGQNPGNPDIEPPGSAPRLFGPSGRPWCGARVRLMAFRTLLSKEASVNGFSRMSKDGAGTPWESRIGWAYPDMKRAGTPGRMAPTRAATSLPSISGMTTSVSRRSIT